MNDYDSDIDIAMHVCHHQLYWEKKNENDNDGISWTRSEYVDYVTQKIENFPTVTKFLESFRHAATGPARPVRQVTTPNDQPRGPPETEHDEKIITLSEMKSLRDSKGILKKRRTRRKPPHQRAKFPREKFSLSQYRKSRKAPQVRSALLKHPVPLLRTLR